MSLEIDPAVTSRVVLEPYLAKVLGQGRAGDAEALRAELASRVWQWHNPYLDGAAARAYRRNARAATRHPVTRHPAQEPPPGNGIR